MKRTLTIVAAMAVLSTAVACEKKDQTPPTPQTSAEQAPSAAPAADTQTAAPAEQSTAAAPGAEGDDAQKGEKVYNEVCATCHGQGIAGAPRTGDKEAWQPRIAKGMETLVRNSIQGYQGNQGVMPAKGGVQSLSDEDVEAAVAYMVGKSR